MNILVVTLINNLETGEQFQGVESFTSKSALHKMVDKHISTIEAHPELRAAFRIMSVTNTKGDK